MGTTATVTQRGRASQASAGPDTGFTSRYTLRSVPPNVTAPGQALTSLRVLCLLCNIYLLDNINCSNAFVLVST